jgi:hypothetical protein
MKFKDTILTFEDDKIAIDDGRSVMMKWEIPIMEKSAEYICQSKGDILEIGFGMGICADFIQAQDVKSHTIIDIHPQVIEKLKVWAKDKDNVIIVEGDWYDAELDQTYDGIFLDTYADEHWDKFKEFALSKANSGAKVTYFDNGYIENEHGFDNISYDYIPVMPEEEGHVCTEDVYNMPKVVI